uniref:Uncharacterized protein n=1 Tax=Helicotheca tamesis TaxID=374047 RepID=A0A6U0GWI7_9STRA|mmetsp:Transcript_3446/g.4667  ORF Transcript_3446/g.4667 Transcript_3446/m.4667 type:complete len:143 (+) Transcript_3446:157-585(+)
MIHFSSNEVNGDDDSFGQNIISHPSSSQHRKAVNRDSTPTKEKSHKNDAHCQRSDVSGSNEDCILVPPEEKDSSEPLKENSSCDLLPQPPKDITTKKTPLPLEPPLAGAAVSRSMSVSVDKETNLKSISSHYSRGANLHDLD